MDRSFYNLGSDQIIGSDVAASERPGDWNQIPPAEDGTLRKSISQPVKTADAAASWSPPHVDLLFRHCCPSHWSRKAFLTSQLFPRCFLSSSSIPLKHNRNISVSYILKEKQMAFVSMCYLLMENYCIKNSTERSWY